MKTYTLRLNYHLTSNPSIIVYGAGDVVSMEEATTLLKDQDKYILSRPINSNEIGLHIPADTFSDSSASISDSPWSE